MTTSYQQVLKSRRGEYRYIRSKKGGGLEKERERRLLSLQGLV
jgi:hypothetical protein